MLFATNQAAALMARAVAVSFTLQHQRVRVGCLAVKHSKPEMACPLLLEAPDNGIGFFLFLGQYVCA
jgi:hypothetical protein